MLHQAIRSSLTASRVDRNSLIRAIYITLLTSHAGPSALPAYPLCLGVQAGASLVSWSVSQEYNLTVREMHMLFAHFDGDSSGSINYHEFLSHCHAPMSAGRMGLVREVFARMDAKRQGVLDLDELVARYKPNAHPDVKQVRGIYPHIPHPIGPSREHTRTSRVQLVHRENIYLQHDVHLVPDLVVVLIYSRHVLYSACASRLADTLGGNEIRVRAPFNFKSDAVRYTGSCTSAMPQTRGFHSPGY
eukprot:9262449-Pyramimonas_sp.AAC.1